MTNKKPPVMNGKENGHSGNADIVVIVTADTNGSGSSSSGAAVNGGDSQGAGFHHHSATTTSTSASSASWLSGSNETAKPADKAAGGVGKDKQSSRDRSPSPLPMVPPGGAASLLLSKSSLSTSVAIGQHEQTTAVETTTTTTTGGAEFGHRKVVNHCTFISSVKFNNITIRNQFQMDIL